jgi:hypothetical protein
MLPHQKRVPQCWTREMSGLSHLLARRDSAELRLIVVTKVSQVSTV